MVAASDVQWGDVPSWVGAVVTSVGVLVAAIAFAFQVRDRHRAQEAAKRAQARMVTVRVEAVRYERLEGVISTHPGPWVKYALHNRNVEPVRDFHLRLRAAADQEAFEVFFKTTLDPGDIEDYAKLTAPPTLKPPRLEATFTDTAGLHWRIDSDGRLAEVDENRGGPDDLPD